MAKNYVQAIPLTSIDSATFTGNYQVLNAGGLPDACILLRIINDSNRDVTISYDGVVPHDYIVLGRSYDYNFQANKQPNGYVSMIKQGTVIHVAGAPGGIGNVYLAGYYNPKN